MESAVVTGAARGLGFEIARLLHARGYAVTLTDVDGEALEAAAAKLGEGVTTRVLDVRDEADCRSCAAEADAAASGGLAVWVNNAGILATGPSWTHDAELRERMFAINTHGTIHGTFAAIERMRPRGRGHVINIVSLAGLGSPPGETVYAATKHAAIAFTLGTLADLRAEDVDDVHLSAVCPDGIWTPMLFDKLDDPDAAASFSGRLLQPAEVAGKAVGLLDRPRPVLTVPRSRGAFVRLFDTFPGPASKATRLWLADARRRQKRWKRKLGQVERAPSREPSP